MTDPDVPRASHWGLALCAVLAAIAISAGVAAVALDVSELALVAAAAGVGAAGVGATVDIRRARAEQAVLEARVQTRSYARQLAEFDDPRVSPSPMGEPTDDWEIDPACGLIREHFLPVVLQQIVASARRKVQPVSVVFWELDDWHRATSAARDEALNALAAVAWRTLRESDTVFRLGDAVALAVLVDTAEPGAAIVADRVRESLRASVVGDSLTVSAGIACYPSHALDPVELVSRAGKALEAARAQGHERDYVVIAAGDQE